MGNCTSKVSAGDDVAARESAKATVVAAADVPAAETPPETPEVNNTATAAAAPPVPTPAPPLPERPVAAPDVEPEKPEEVAAASPEPPVAEEPEKQPKQQTFDKWLEEECKSMTYIPRKGHEELQWDAIYPPQKDLEKPVTQCCAWISAVSVHVLMAADLGGGTLFDWWNMHIGKGEAETDLPADELFERAVVGLKATIFPELREAVEAGAESAVKENLHLKVLLKNCFDAPAPPEGTTGGGDGKWNVLRPQKFFETTKA